MLDGLFGKEVTLGEMKAETFSEVFEELTDNESLNDILDRLDTTIDSLLLSVVEG